MGGGRRRAVGGCRRQSWPEVGRECDPAAAPPRQTTRAAPPRLASAARGRLRVWVRGGVRRRSD